MASSVVYEAYAPVILEDPDFTSRVTPLVREYFDVGRSKAAVLSRLDGRLISAVSNSAVVFGGDDLRYYAGRLIAPNSKHNSRKIAQISKNIKKAGLLNKFAGSVFALKLDSVVATEIESTNGKKKTLIVAEQSQVWDDEATELRKYIDDVAGAVNSGVQGRATLGSLEFNSLCNYVPIVSLGSLAVGSEESVRKLTNNINELVSSPIDAAVYIEDALTTITKVVDNSGQ